MSFCNWHIRLILLLCGLLTSCDLIEFHPYDIRKDSGEHDLNNLNISRIEASDDDNDTIRFIFISDTQRFYDETQAFVKAANQLNGIDFVIHGGDITDFGLSKEYLWIHGLLKKLKMPYVAIIGNHDMIGHGKEVYRNIYGDYNFSFTFRNTRFICINTNALEGIEDTPIPDLDFMSRFTSDTAGIENNIVVMHSPPNDVQFNGESVNGFKRILESYKNPLFCLHGHLHQFEVNEYLNNGIKFYGCDDMSGRNYILFTIIGNKYTSSLVYF